MLYKFFGEPNMLVKSRHKKPFEGTIQQRPLFRFDGNGEYVTSDEKLIEKLKSRFDHREITELQTEVEEIVKPTSKKKVIK